MDILEYIKQMQEIYGDKVIITADKLEKPPKTVFREMFQNAFTDNKADGGRIGFYKGSFVEGEGWVVRFASPTMKSKGIEMDDKWFGKQVFETEEAMNAAIEERKKISKKNTELKNKKLAERITREAEKGYKEIIDDFIEKGDYENFKSEIYESQMKKKIRSGKLRQTKGGRVPTHIVKFIRERLDAGPDTDLFEDLKRITGRTEEELLEFSKNIGPSEFTKTGKRKNVMPIKQRSESAIESWPEDRKLTDEEKLEGERKQKEARKIKEAVGTKYASELELKNAAKIKTQISDLNTMFKNKPELINTPQYAKLKEMMEIQIAGKDKTLPSGKKVKAGELFRREVDSKGNLITDDYYIKKAKEGKIMSFFDINKVGTQMGKYATNINITPSLFNSAFIQGQVETYFKKGGKFYGDAEKLKKVDDYLKSIGVTVKISDTDDYYKKGRIGGGDPVFYDSKTGNFPHITKTLNTMGFKDNALTPIKGDTKFVKSVGKNEINPKALIKQVEKDYAKLSTNKRCKFNSGGPANLAFCAKEGKKRLEQIILKGGAKEGEQELAKKILQAGRGLRGMVSLSGMFGPAATAFLVGTEAGLVGYDMISQGKTFREAVGDSVFNYALGDRTKIDPKEERYKGYAAAGVDKDTIGKISAFENAMDEVKNMQQEFEKEDVAYRDAVTGGPRISGAIKQKQIKNYYDQVKKNQELIKYLEQPQTQEKLKIVDDDLFPAMLTDADAKRKAMQMTKPLTVGFGNTMDFLFPKATYREDRERAINYMPAVQEYYRGGQFASGGLASLTDTIPPESGPMSQGLRSLYNNDMDY